MDSTQLKWTKNINREDGEWAYSHKDNLHASEIFKLHWKPDSAHNAGKPEQGDLAILRQKTRVTHLVEFVDIEEPKEDSNNSWLYRLVKVVWIVDVWNEPPHQNDVFDCTLRLHGGKIMELENLKNLKERWDTQGGIAGFQKHIQQKIKW